MDKYQDFARELKILCKIILSLHEQTFVASFL